MYRKPQTVLLPALALASLLAGAAIAMPFPPAEPEPEPEPLAPELLDARSLYVQPSTFGDLDSQFKLELQTWGRFELVEMYEADLVMVLEAESIFVPRPVVSKEADEDDPLGERAQGTAIVLESLRLRIFVPWGEDVWKTEVEVGDGTESAKILVAQLRELLEASE